MRQYVPTNLNTFLNESKTIMLKRKYGENNPVVVGSNAPLRNQVLSYVSESVKVSKNELKKFIAGLNEGSKNPVASANMWLTRNSKFFITESKNGVTYFKLSPIGKRLASGLSTNNQISESEESNIRRKINENVPLRFPRNAVIDPEDFNEFEDFDDQESAYDFLDRRKGRPRPGIYDKEIEETSDPEDFTEFPEDSHYPEDDLEDDECCVGETCDVTDDLDESSKQRIKNIIENLRSKNAKKLNEDKDEESEDEDDKSNDIEDKDDADELTFDDINLEGGDDEESEEGEEDNKEDDEEGLEDTEESEEGDEDKVEITEFVITVDNVDDAISELSDLDVEAEQVLDEEGEPIEHQIKVSADYWEPLKGWLENKGVDIAEMFGGEIETEEGEEEDLEDEEEGLEDTEDLEGGKEGEELEDLDIDISGDLSDLDKDEEKEEEKE